MLFSKSIIIQVISYLIYSYIAIIILLLNAIGEEQAKKILKLPSTNSKFLNQYTISIVVLLDIYRGLYTYILLLLELLTQKRVCYILTNLVFQLYITIIIINKVYLISNQGNSFYSTYIELQVVQVLLGRKLQFIYIAILDNITLVNIQRLVEFNIDIYIICTLVD